MQRGRHRFTHHRSTLDHSGHPSHGRTSVQQRCTYRGKRLSTQRLFTPGGGQRTAVCLGNAARQNSRSGVVPDVQKSAAFLHVPTTVETGVMRCAHMADPSDGNPHSPQVVSRACCTHSGFVSWELVARSLKYDQCCNESNTTLVPFVLSTFGHF